MIERVLPAIAAVAAPLLGLLLRASRRSRLQRRIDEYLRLAERIEPRDSDAAAELVRLASECAHLLVIRDRRALGRKIDPGAVLALLFLTVPAIVGAVFASRWDGSWKWLVVAFCIIWTLLWGGVGITQLWAERSDDAEATG